MTPPQAAPVVNHLADEHRLRSVEVRCHDHLNAGLEVSTFSTIEVFWLTEVARAYLALLAEIEGLKLSVKELRAQQNVWVEANLKANSAKQAAEAKVAALLEYVKHDWGCDVWVDWEDGKTGDDPCTCGLAAALAPESKP